MINDQTKYDQTFWSVNYKKLWSSICYIVFFCKICLLVVLDRYLVCFHIILLFIKTLLKLIFVPLIISTK